MIEKQVPYKLNTQDTLNRLIVPGTGIHTSLGENFNNTIFGRDSLISARELLSYDSSVALDVIRTLSGMQGKHNHAASGEEPGRIIHEYRDFKTWEAPNLALKGTVYGLSYLWGGDKEKMQTYFSNDSTPLFTLLVTDYAKLHPEIMDDIKIKTSLVQANDWIISHVADSGLVEIDRSNKLSLFHHTWKDSTTGYVDESGELANIFDPIAYLDIQALSAGGLSASAKLLNNDFPEKASEWRQASDKIAKNTINQFWMPDKQFFASAIDKDSSGYDRRLDVMQSDAGRILNTSLFDSISAEERKKYVSGVVENLFSKDFLTDVGIRCRSLADKDKSGFADYHGSLVSWPIDTYLIAQGLKRQGLPKLAKQLENRVLNAVEIAGNHYELFYVTPDGKAVLDPEKAREKGDDNKALPIEMYPESNIAWTVAAVNMIKQRHSEVLEDDKNTSQPWQIDLEKKIIANIKDFETGKSIKLEQADVWLEKESPVRFKILKKMGRLALEHYSRSTRQAFANAKAYNA